MGGRMLDGAAKILIAQFFERWRASGGGRRPRSGAGSLRLIGSARDEAGAPSTISARQAAEGAGGAGGSTATRRASSPAASR